MRVIAVDWSGAATRGGGGHIALAEATRSGRLDRLECGLSREDVLNRVTVGDIVGFDFAFSCPAWFAERIGVASAPDLWAYVVQHGEDWLTRCEPPFWGRRGHPRPKTPEARFRQAELALPRTGGIGPKSLFQIGGAGAVGTGSIRGMPLLSRLHAAGARIWPFTAVGAPLVVEIYPRLLTGPIRKSNQLARQRFLADRYPGLGPEHRAAATRSEDAFDAAVSALVMIEHADDLVALLPEADPILRLEGRIWHPRWRADRLETEAAIPSTAG
jgi:hypothetical protein